MDRRAVMPRATVTGREKKQLMKVLSEYRIGISCIIAHSFFDNHKIILCVNYKCGERAKVFTGGRPARPLTLTGRGKLVAVIPGRRARMGEANPESRKGFLPMSVDSGPALARRPGMT